MPDSGLTQPRAPAGRILVLEPDDAAAWEWCTLLACPGWELHLASSGREVLSLLAAERFSLLVLRLSPPVEDSLSLLGRVRREPRTAALPVLVLTRGELGQARLACLSLGVDALLEHPVEPERLRGTVAELLRRTGAGLGRRPAGGQAQVGQTRPTILLSLDDQVVAWVIRRHLELEGFRAVSLPADGSRPLGELARGAAAAILQVGWPERDDHQLLRRLRSEPGLERLPIIALTHRARLEQAARAFTLGADEYVSLPVSPQGMTARIRRLLRLHQALRGAAPTAD